MVRYNLTDYYETEEQDSTPKKKYAVEFVHCYSMSKSEFAEPWNNENHLLCSMEPLKRNKTLKRLARLNLLYKNTMQKV